MKEYCDEIQEYPVGEQDFKTLREGHFLYVDKTGFVDMIVRRRMKYLFLARPRRFGKSLFLSTLRYFFEGRRDLFEGLYIDSTDWTWDEYPVLYFDLNTDRYFESDQLDELLENLFCRWEKKYGAENIGLGHSQRFNNIIEAAHRKTGRQVVILVDEYDKPLVSNINNKGSFEHFRAKLSSIYTNFKSSAEHIKLVFITGVSRFSKLSVFSDLNNLRDLTFSEEFSDICGITERELNHYFTPGINHFARKEGISSEQVRTELKVNYDGYRFTPNGSEIYNPWSVLNAMNESAISNYWAQTGKATLIVEALRDRDVDLEKILNTDCTTDQLSGLDLSNLEPLPLLYQTGYLTIKDYDRETKLCRLGVPNREVSRDLFEELLPYYISVDKDTPAAVARDILNSILKGEPVKMMESIDIFLAGIPYEMKIEDENNFHNAVYILLRLIGARVDTEVHTSNGRIDLTVETSRFIYIIELKFNKEAHAAMAQIDKKEYDRLYHNDPRRIYLIGANFNRETRRLDPVEIREVK